jgi:tetratricopeptide (TPR) repeat protein
MTFAKSSGLTLMAILLAAFLTYSPALEAPFLFDDGVDIVGNANLTGWSILFPSSDSGPVAGRPLLNLSFAADHALFDFTPWFYRVENILIHALCAWLIYLIVGNTLTRMKGWWSKFVVEIAGLSALLWLVHPLQTESVTYISQRAESLAILFYLLAWYGLVRGTRAWLTTSAISLLLGVMVKETVATAPLLFFLYDVIFLSGKMAISWKKRWGYYLMLLPSWVVVGILIAGGHHRGGTVGFGLGVSSLDYALTQIHALPCYLLLCFVPWPLCLDYGNALYTTLGQLWPFAIALLTMIGAAGWLWWRDRRLGFLAVMFFLPLAPSSSIVPLAIQTMAEHRLYLSLSALCILAVLWAYRYLGSKAIWPLLIAGIVFGVLTVNRNFLYTDPVALWEQTVAQSPAPGRAENNLGDALLKAGRISEAVVLFRKSLNTDPNKIEAEQNLAAALLQSQDYDGAVPYLLDVAKIHPNDPSPYYQLGEAYLALERGAEAESWLRKAMTAGYKPLAPVWAGLGNALQLQGDVDAALPALLKAEELDPQDAAVHYNIAGIYWNKRQANEAEAEYQKVLDLTPHDAQARNNLGIIKLQSGDVEGARTEFEIAIQDDPGNANARSNLLHLHEDER